MQHKPKGTLAPRLSLFTPGVRSARRLAVLAGAAAICASILPAATATATTAGHAAATGPSPTLKEVLAKANALSEQIDSLSEQYDSLKIQLSQARAAAKVASQTAARDEQLLGSDENSIGAIAVENYMSGGLSPALQLLETSSPQDLLNRASMMSQLERENGDKLNLVAAAATAALRAREAAVQEQQHAKSLSAQMRVKVAAIQKRENYFNSQAFKKAQAVYDATGKYPSISVRGDSIGVQALRWALTRVGWAPYVWGAAGPDSFDCSGLVVWAYGKLGITLEHFTGDLWNEIVHVSRSELKPGDLVFFYAGIDHVGIYLGGGMMVDAPTFGQDVQVQPVMWDVYDGGGYVPA